MKIFDFVNELERMSVIVQNDNNFTLLAKGSPEKMKAIFKTLPKDYEKSM